MVVDANVWVSSLVVQDTHHAASRAWLAARIASREQLVVPSLAIPEVAGAIARRTGSADLGDQAVTQMIRTPGLRVVPLEVDLASEAAHVASSFGLRGADAVYASVARMLAVPLVTWDQEVEARASGLVQVIRPR